MRKKNLNYHTIFSIENDFAKSLSYEAVIRVHGIYIYRERERERERQRERELYQSIIILYYFYGMYVVFGICQIYKNKLFVGMYILIKTKYLHLYLIL